MTPPRAPEHTRQHILQVTAEELRLHGYKDTSLSDILRKAEVSKGALYHHFDSKKTLAYAVFDEVFVNEFLENWSMPFSSDEPMRALSDWMRQFSETICLEELQVGCPVHNLAVEMSALDEGFRGKVIAMFKELERRMASAIDMAKEAGQVKDAVVAKDVAAFIIVMIQGAMNQGKYARDLDSFQASLRCLSEYIDNLRT